MIEYVSASKNGNSVPEIAKTNPEYLWPRCCDRLEAIGTIGAVRCYQYALEIGNKLALPNSTPMPKTSEELWSFVVPERFDEYQRSCGKSASMLDHYYDKLLQIAHFKEDVIQNKFLC